MLVIDDLTVRVAGRACSKTPRSASPGARVGLVGRNGSGKIDAVQRDHRRHLGRAWQRRTAAALAHRAARAGSTERAGKPARGRAQGRHRTRRSSWPEAETAQDPHRIAEIQTRLADIGAHAAPARAAVDPVGPGLFQCRSGSPLLGILRRLAHAGRARRHVVRRAGAAAARRADQLSRSRRHAVAAGSPGALSAHHDDHQPRPRFARHRGRPDPVAGERRSSRSIAAAIPTSNGCAASA